MADLDGQRTWEREREAELAFHEAELADLRDYGPTCALMAARLRASALGETPTASRDA